MIKRIILSMLLAISFLAFTATASNAWHFDVTYSGEGWFDSSEQNFYLDDGMGVMANAGWSFR